MTDKHASVRELVGKRKGGKDAGTGLESREPNRRNSADQTIRPELGIGRMPTGSDGVIR